MDSLIDTAGPLLIYRFIYTLSTKNTPSRHVCPAPGNVYPLGTLARFGYVGSPKQLFCPTFKKHGTGVQNDFDLGGYYWQYWTSGNLVLTHGALANAYRYQLGVSSLFYVRGAATYTSRYRTTVGFVADTWRTRRDRYTGVSPVWVACRNSSSPNATSRLTYLSTGEGLSHDGEGVNALFYDGSARWVGLGEVQNAGWKADTHVYSAADLRNSYPSAFLLNNFSQDAMGYVTNFNAWARSLD